MKRKIEWGAIHWGVIDVSEKIGNVESVHFS